MAHFHDKGRAVAFDLFLIGSPYLELARAVLHLRMIFRHEALTQGIQLVRAGTVDPVHARTAEPLGNQRSLLPDVHIDNRRSRLIGQRVLTAGVERAVPGIVGIACGIGRGPVAAVAERQNNRGRADDVTGPVQNPVPHSTGHAAVFDQQPGNHDVIQHVHAAAAQMGRHQALDPLAFRNIDMPRRFAASGGTQVTSIRAMKKLHAQPLKKADHVRHNPAPVPQHGFTEAAARLKMVFYQIVNAVIRFIRAQNGQKMVISPAEAAGTFQLSLIHHQHTRPGPARGERRAASRRSGAKNKQFRFKPNITPHESFL